MTTLTRRYHFSASHRLHSAVLNEDENARLYGKCNNPFGHGHDYTLEVTVVGEADATSGLIIPVGRLDDFVQDNILRLFSHRNINLDVPQFAELVPTTENLASVVGQIIEKSWPDSFGARPVRIQIQETGRNGFELQLKEREESIRIHV